MSIIDSLKRLERAGQENSRVTQKLHGSARDVADRICRQAPVGVPLPRGYQVCEHRSNVGSALFLYKYTPIPKSDPDYDPEYNSHESLCIDGTGGYLHGDFHCEVPSQTREGSLTFSHDIATGLLDEIAEFIEKRSRKALEASDVLEKAGEVSREEG